MRSARSTGQTGRQAEALVAARLEGEGYEILARNARVGRLELDIVARQGSLLVVCEVRSRTTTRFGSPAESIDRAKIGRIRRATAQWLRENRPGTRTVRFDAAAVTFAHGEAKLHYYEQAF